METDIHQLLLFNLCVVDVVACVVQPTNTVNNSSHGGGVFFGLIGQLGCEIVKFLNVASISVSALTLTAVSLQR